MKKIIKIVQSDSSFPTYLTNIGIQKFADNNTSNPWFNESTKREDAMLFEDDELLQIAYQILNKYIKHFHKTYQLYIEDYEVA